MLFCEIFNNTWLPKHLQGTDSDFKSTFNFFFFSEQAKNVALDLICNKC